MRILDYPLTEEVGPTDLFLMDGDNGTKALPRSTLGNGTKKRNYTEMLEEMYDIYDRVGIPYQMRRNIFRGKNLGSEFTAEQKAHIADGSFKGFFIGDYWETSDNRYRIADINYWLHTGDTECTTNHLVIVPDKSVRDPCYMNSTNVTTGGYNGSSFRTQGRLNSFINGDLQSTFSKDFLLHRDELIVNATTNGYSSGVVWDGTSVTLLNEPMVYGSYTMTPGTTASIVPFRTTIDKTQLSLFKLHPEFIVLREDDGTRRAYWLRDVVGTEQFAIVYITGVINSGLASLSLYVRPVFGIGGDQNA